MYQAAYDYVVHVRLAYTSCLCAETDLRKHVHSVPGVKTSKPEIPAAVSTMKPPPLHSSFYLVWSTLNRYSYIIWDNYIYCGLLDLRKPHYYVVFILL